MLKQAVSEKLNQWGREALLFCAAHGRKGGEFELNRWANGRVMAEVPGARCNQAISPEELAELRANGWRIFVGGA